MKSFRFVLFLALAPLLACGSNTGPDDTDEVVAAHLRGISTSS